MVPVVVTDSTKVDLISIFSEGVSLGEYLNRLEKNAAISNQFERLFVLREVLSGSETVAEGSRDSQDTHDNTTLC